MQSFELIHVLVTFIYNIQFLISWYFHLVFNARFYLIKRVLILILKCNWEVLLSFRPRWKYSIYWNTRDRFRCICCV